MLFLLNLKHLFFRAKKERPYFSFENKSRYVLGNILANNVKFEIL